MLWRPCQYQYIEIDKIVWCLGLTGWQAEGLMFTQKVCLFVQGGRRFPNFIGGILQFHNSMYLSTLNSFPLLNSEISPQSCTGDSMVSSEARGARPSLSTSICSLALRNFTRDNHWKNTRYQFYSEKKSFFLTKSFLYEDE